MQFPLQVAAAVGSIDRSEHKSTFWTQKFRSNLWYIARCITSHHFLFITACILSQINRKTLNLSEKSPPSKCGHSRKKKTCFSVDMLRTTLDEMKGSGAKCLSEGALAEVQDQFRHNGTINLTMDPLWRRSNTIMPKNGKRSVDTSLQSAWQPDNNNVVCAAQSFFIFYFFCEQRRLTRLFKAFPFLSK